MPEPIRSAVVVGGGSAGFLAALTFRRMLPQIKLTVVHSPDIPIIGVGESTTGRVPLHLHESLGIGRDEFHRQVRPSWKLGLRLEWGAADVQVEGDQVGAAFVGVDGERVCRADGRDELFQRDGARFAHGAALEVEAGPIGG